MMKFKYLVVVLSLASLLLLYLLSGLSQPPVLPLSKIPENEGKQVIVQGIVTGYQTTKTGSTLITIRNDDPGNTTTILLYVEGPLTVEYGDLVQATGTVQQYNNQWEIAVDSPQSVTILEQWKNRSFPLWQLAQNPMRYVDTNVNVTGIIGPICGSGFTLQDSTGTYSLPVSYDHLSDLSFSKGDQVAVKARFLYDKTTLRYLLKLDKATDVITVGSQ